MGAKRPRPTAKPAPAWKGPWRIHFFQRHKDDDATRPVPGRAFLDACPTSVAAKLVATVKAVADAPPPMFSGGGKWEAMHGDMGGFYEARADGPNREHFRLFCLLDRMGVEAGLGGPSLVILCGAQKPFKTTLTDGDYAKVRALGAEFLKRNPRSVAS